MSEFEWIPAIMNPIHDYGDDSDNALSLRGKRIRIRPVKIIDETSWPVDCDAERFYEIHPDDVNRIAPWRNGAASSVCEHEVLTD